MSTMRHHIAEKPVERIEPRDQPHEFRRDKPAGFWYEVDGDWRRWCASEDMTWLSGRLLYRLELGDENILRPTDLLAFTREYEQWDDLDRKFPSLGPSGIDWVRVAKDYDGIEIAPYQWEWRLGPPVSGWYYTWDCASGVIWRPKGAKLELLERLPALQTDGQLSKE